jgi:hypothetical protein
MTALKPPKILYVDIVDLEDEESNDVEYLYTVDPDLDTVIDPTQFGQLIYVYELKSINRVQTKTTLVPIK